MCVWQRKCVCMRACMMRFQGSNCFASTTTPHHTHTHPHPIRALSGGKVTTLRSMQSSLHIPSTVHRPTYLFRWLRDNSFIKLWRSLLSCRSFIWCRDSWKQQTHKYTQKLIKNDLCRRFLHIFYYQYPWAYPKHTKNTVWLIWGGVRGLKQSPTVKQTWTSKTKA